MGEEAIIKNFSSEDVSDWPGHVHHSTRDRRVKARPSLKNMWFLNIIDLR